MELIFPVDGTDGELCAGLCIYMYMYVRVGTQTHEYYTNRSRTLAGVDPEPQQSREVTK